MASRIEEVSLSSERDSSLRERWVGANSNPEFRALDDDLLRGAVKAPTAVGTGEDHHEQLELSRLIDIVNQRFGTEFKPADQLFFDQIREEAVADTHIQQAAMVNSLENFKYVFDKALEGKFIDRMDQNQEIFARYMNDPAFAEVVAEFLRKQVYEQIRAETRRDAVQQT